MAEPLGHLERTDNSANAFTRSSQAPVKKKNRESQPEPTVTSRRRAIGLAKTIEDMRQKLRFDTNTRVNHRKLRMFTIELSRDVHLPTRIGELNRIRNEVPGNLLQSNRLTEHSQTRRP